MRVETQDPRISPLSPSWRPSLVPTHFLLEKAGYFVHLVIFYERSSNSFWFDRFAYPAAEGVTRRSSTPVPSKLHRDYADDDDENKEDDETLNARFVALSTRLRLGAEAAGSVSRIETTRVNLDGVKVFVPKVRTWGR